MNLFDMVGLIPAVYQLDLQNHPEHLHARVLEAPDVYPWVSPNGAWLYMPNYDEINKTLDTMFDAPQVALDQPTAAECPLHASTPPPTDAPTPVSGHSNYKQFDTDPAATIDSSVANEIPHRSTTNRCTADSRANP